MQPNPRCNLPSLWELKHTRITRHSFQGYLCSKQLLGRRLWFADRGRQPQGVTMCRMSQKEEGVLIMHLCLIGTNWSYYFASRYKCILETPPGVFICRWWTPTLWKHLLIFLKFSGSFVPNKFIYFPDKILFHQHWLNFEIRDKEAKDWGIFWQVRGRMGWICVLNIAGSICENTKDVILRF